MDMPRGESAELPVRSVEPKSAPEVKKFSNVISNATDDIECVNKCLRDQKDLHGQCG